MDRNSNKSGLSEKKIKHSSDKQISLLKRLRMEKGLSLSELAKRASTQRHLIGYIENKNIDHLEVREIYSFASGLGCHFMDLVNVIRGSKDPDIMKCSLEKPKFVLRFEGGSELLSLVDRDSNDFVGILNHKSNGVVMSSLMPGYQSLFGVVLKGCLGINRLGKEELLEEKNCFVIRGSSPFELRNANFPYPLSVIIFSRILESE